MRVIGMQSSCLPDNHFRQVNVNHRSDGLQVSPIGAKKHWFGLIPNSSFSARQKLFLLQKNKLQTQQRNAYLFLFLLRNTKIITQTTTNRTIHRTQLKQKSETNIQNQNSSQMSTHKSNECLACKSLSIINHSSTGSSSLSNHLPIVLYVPNFYVAESSPGEEISILAVRSHGQNAVSSLMDGIEFLHIATTLMM